MGCILLIDDDALQVRVRETVLRQAGVEVCVATTAEGALALLRSQVVRIDGVVTDHLLPTSSGPELVRKIRAVHPRLAVLVLTGKPDAEEEYAGLNVLFRLKPLPPAELIAIVQSMVPRAA